MDVSIVIVNYHTSPQIRECVRSIRKFSEGFSFEIIIVDNNSEPDLKGEYADQKDVRVILLQENVGFGRANNAGFEIAKGRYLLCLNPDTLLLNNAIGLMIKFMDAHPDVGACGANLYNSDMAPTLSFRRRLPGLWWEMDDFLNLKPEKLLYGRNRVFNHSGEPLEVGYITGADLMVRRGVYEKIGGFDPKFFMYFEETDWCRRIKRAGGKICSVPEARIQHLEGGSFSDGASVSPARIARSESGKKVYYRKNFNPVYRALLYFIYFLTLSTRSLLVREPERRRSWRLRLKQYFPLRGR